MAKEKTIPDLEKELSKALEDLGKAEKALATITDENERLKQELASEKENVVSLIEGGVPVEISSTETVISLIKNGIVREVTTEAEAKKWEELGFKQKVEEE